jgi:uncharacterized protein YjaG (DUF416 family)
MIIKMANTNIDILKGLDFKKQVSFAYLACERAFPNYVYFSQNYEFGDADVLREGIDFVYDSIFNKGGIDKIKIESLLTAIYQNIPNTNDFTTFYATIAMYSGGIIYEGVNLLKNPSNEKILKDISTMSTDAIDCFIQERDNMDYDDDDFEEKIINDDLMKTEIKIQTGIISYLKSIDNNVEPSDIQTLLRIQQQEPNYLTLQ